MTRIPSEALGERAFPSTWSLGSAPWQSYPPLAGPRCRVIIDNDFSGDPDDLFALVHHLLSPSVDIRLVVGSHLRPDDPFDPSPHSARNAVAVLHDVFDRMGLESRDVIVQGADLALTSTTTPQESAAATAIVAEAMRDEDSPLFFVAGGGLTDLASALLLDPRIAERMTVVWIGGAEHEGLAVPPPGAMPIEYNLLIDVVAGQVVFNESHVPVWQIPRDVYRQCLVSDAELRCRVAASGDLGRYLYEEVRAVIEGAAHTGGVVAETYALGDSPLVLLTALQSLFERDPSSSRHVIRSTPLIDDAGRYIDRPEGRPMRIYTWVDTRLMFEDFFAKIAEFAEWQNALEADLSGRIPTTQT